MGSAPQHAHHLLKLALFVALTAALLCLGACAKSEPNDMRSPPADPTQGAALVSLAEAHHKRADIALQQERRDDAKAELGRLLENAEPHRGALPESWDVLFDASARLARLHREDNALTKAESVARSGLRDEEDAPVSIFRGYLHKELGHVLEARGDLRGAVEHHGQAIDIFKTILDAGKPTPPTEPALDAAQR